MSPTFERRHMVTAGALALSAVLSPIATAASLAAQTMDGIVVVGANRVALQKTPIFLINGRLDVVDSTTTDVFGGFTLTAKRQGKYSLLVRRAGYYPIVTQDFELLDDDIRRDTVYLEGRQAELSIQDVLTEEVRRVFGGHIMSGFQRYMGPEDIEKVRHQVNSLGDIIRNGRFVGLQWVNPPSGCLRFSGAQGCAQVFIDGLPINMRIDAIMASDIEAVLAFRAIELGAAASSRGALDTSRFGAVMVFTRRFQPR